MREREEIEK